MKPSHVDKYLFAASPDQAVAVYVKDKTRWPTDYEMWLDLIHVGQVDYDTISYVDTPNGPYTVRPCRLCSHPVLNGPTLCDVCARLDFRLDILGQAGLQWKSEWFERMAIKFMEMSEKCKTWSAEKRGE